MKHLKLFEDKFEIGYEKVGEGLYYRLCDQSVDISESEFNEIKSIFNPIINISEGYPHFTRDRRGIYIFTIFKNSIEISKFEDDWWLIHMPYTRNWVVSLSKNQWVCYKCDQMYGIKEFYDNKIFHLLNGLGNKDKFTHFPWK